MAETMKRLESVLDPTVDTLILAECVLAYMAPEESNALLAYLGRFLQRPFAVCYEMCVAGSDDTGLASALQAPPSRFGNVMLANLEVSGREYAA